ncbi:glutamine amidotransferase-related protein [Pseudomonas typographi]|uniref:CTP synthase (glutamine hydrolyzing) n=1 Tax=Pseudomonas typographi TaxID=2715964 RepID=A0ABR7Z4A2_9PSED|nr:gamma-glutamyl-gamma-aminobutyrate hydrolase family protein [Pseudomonas typographi]MBD1600282.1 C26 family cysteine hydrolase domain-containing family [Pseudomonas typographi]
MPLTLIHHDTHAPAVFSAAAAIAARSLGLALRYLQPQFDFNTHPDAQQHVGAGQLLPSGLLWHARWGGHCEGPSSPAEVLAAAGAGWVAMPWHPAWYPPTLLDALLADARSAGIEVHHIRVQGSSEHWHFENDLFELGAWQRDRYGRPALQSLAGDCRAAAVPIAVIGTEHEQRDTYPATLAALGDAADALGIRLDIHWVAAPAFSEAKLRGVAGIVLPGGASMHNVAGQVRVAQHALEQGVALLGLCLGMQSMVTAMARLALPGEDIHMAEAQPTAKLKSFVPMQAYGLAPWRIGPQPSIPANASAQARLGAHHTLPCNHRFMLNPALRERLEAAGLTVLASDPSGQIVDAVESAAHRFFIGLQGHPEQASCQGSPHPVIRGFLLQCLKSSHKLDV